MLCELEQANSLGGDIPRRVEDCYVESLGDVSRVLGARIGHFERVQTEIDAGAKGDTVLVKTQETQCYTFVEAMAERGESYLAGTHASRQAKIVRKISDE